MPLSDIVRVKYVGARSIYLYFYTDPEIPEDPAAKYTYLEDQKVVGISNVLKNFEILQDLIKLLAFLVYVSMDDILRFSFKLTDGNINHKIIVIGNKKKRWTKIVYES
jgi:hypothetical protein